MPIALAKSDGEIRDCFPIMVQLRPKLIESEWLQQVRRMEKEGFQLAALREDGAVRAVAVLAFLWVKKLGLSKKLRKPDGP